MVAQFEAGQPLRDLGPTEAFVVQVQAAAKDCCPTANNIVCLVQLRSAHALPLDVLRRALTLTVARHPLLHAHIVARKGLLGNRYAFVDRDAQHAFSLSAHPAVDWQAVMSEMLRGPWALPDDPLLRVVYIAHAAETGRYELVFGVHHAIADASCVFAIVEEVLHVAGRILQDQPLDLAPPKDLLDSIWAYAPRHPIRWGQLLRAVSHYVTTPFSPRVARLPLDDVPSAGQAQTKYHYDPLTRAESAQVIARARHLQTSVGALVGAALLLALPEAPPQQNITLGLSSIVDLRRRVQPPLADDRMVHGASQVQTYYEVGPATQLRSLAQEVRSKIGRTLESGVLWDVGRLIRYFIPLLLGHLRYRGRLRFPYSLIFSNVGRLSMPSRIGPFEIALCTLAADYSFGVGNLFLALLTFEERLVFNWTFGALKRETLLDYAARVKNLLLDSDC